MLFSIFARLTIFLMMPMAAFAVGAVLLGETQPVHPALRGFVEGCGDTSQPCWYGIIPGQTPLDEALMIIERLGFVVERTWAYGEVRNYFNADSCRFSISERIETDKVFAIAADECQELRLGDFITVFGVPLDLPPPRGDGCGNDQRISYYEGGIVFRSVGFQPFINTYFTPPSVQTVITTFYVDADLPSSDRIWRDFSPTDISDVLRIVHHVAVVDNLS